MQILLWRTLQNLDYRWEENYIMLSFFSSNVFIYFLLYPFIWYFLNSCVSKTCQMIQCGDLWRWVVKWKEGWRWDQGRVLIMLANEKCLNHGCINGWIQWMNPMFNGCINSAFIKKTLNQWVLDGLNNPWKTAYFSVSFMTTRKIKDL